MNNFIDFSNPKQVENFIDTYKSALERIVKTNAIALEYQKNHADDKTLGRVVNLKDARVTDLILTVPLGYEAYNSATNNCCIEWYQDEQSVIEFIDKCIFDVSRASKDENVPAVLVDKFNDLFLYIAEHFNASQLYKTGVAFRAHANTYISSENVRKCALMATCDDVETVNGTSRVVPSACFTTVEDALKFMRESSGIDSVSESKIKTMILISSIITNEFDVGQVYKAYCEEIVAWTKDIDRIEGKLSAEELDAKYGLIYHTDFGMFFVYAYKNLCNSGDVNSVIKQYEESYDPEINDAELKKHIDAEVKRIREYRYYCTQMFLEALSDGNNVKQLIPPVLALFVLSHRPTSNTAAFQVHGLFEEYFTKLDGVTYRVNSCFVNYGTHDAKDPIDLNFADLLRLVMGFNNSTSEYRAAIYYKNQIDFSKYWNDVTWTRFMRSILYTIKLNVLKPNAKGEMPNVGLKFDGTDDLDKVIGFLDNEIAETQKICDEILAKRDSANAGAVTPGDIPASQPQDYLEYYKQKIKSLESTKNSLKEARFRYENNVSELNDLEAASDAVYNERNNTRTEDFGYLPGTKDFVGMDEVKDGEIPLWPSRVVDPDYYDVDERDPKHAAATGLEEKKRVETLKAGEIFRYENDIKNKNGCL